MHTRQALQQLLADKKGRGFTSARRACKDREEVAEEGAAAKRYPHFPLQSGADSGDESPAAVDFWRAGVVSVLD